MMKFYIFFGWALFDAFSFTCMVVLMLLDAMCGDRKK